MHMASRKDLNSAELETVEVSKNPTTVVTAQRRSANKRRSDRACQRIGLFVTAKLLFDTRAILSLGKLCENHRYSYDRTSGQKPQLIKDGRK